MEIILDNQIVRLLSENAAETAKIPLIFDQGNQISFRWPSLLEYLEPSSQTYPNSMKRNRYSKHTLQC